MRSNPGKPSVTSAKSGQKPLSSKAAVKTVKTKVSADELTSKVKKRKSSSASQIRKALAPAVRVAKANSKAAAALASTAAAVAPLKLESSAADSTKAAAPLSQVSTPLTGALSQSPLRKSSETTAFQAGGAKIPVRRGGYRPGAFEATKTLAELSDQPIEFKVGDNAVYPGHGVGRVNAIESKDIGGKKLTFYSIQILESGMKIMVPQGNVKNVGLRPIISKQEADHVICILKETNIKIANQTWNRRYREYMEKIKTGGVREIAEVLRDLFLLKVDKELSFGERKMLDTARSLLIKELILATGRDQLEKEDDVKAILGL